jgi:riboflavin kinase/FMN adenylyltransferase
MTVLDLQNHNRQLNPDVLGTCSVSAALGCFDGVHLGHAALLRAACEEAEKNGTAPAVWTFFNPPFPGRARILTDLSEKLTLFASYGIRYAFLYDFHEIRSLSPAQFVEDILIGQCHVRTCVCGFNFRFGKNAAGTPELLEQLLLERGGTMRMIPEITMDGLPISATRIRALLSDGDTVSAARCLGRQFTISLPVVHGKALGRTIGIPTINQNPSPQMQIPRDGIYATAVTIGDMVYPAVTNIGSRPSIDEDNHIPNIETHIIGYHGWLYDRQVTVAFRHRLRDEIRFSSLDELKAQIASDILASQTTFHESK